jgi:phosphoesterase RecJ-like protein
VVDVAAIAAQYGGGGHVRAAGCTIEGDSDAIVAALVAEIAKQL